MQKPYTFVICRSVLVVAKVWFIFKNLSSINLIKNVNVLLYSFKLSTGRKNMSHNGMYNQNNNNNNKNDN